MSNPTPQATNDVTLRLLALARWENEGGTPRPIDRVRPERIAEQKTPALTDAEIIALRIRVIALENLLIALLATASEPQLELARNMIFYISPRPGSIPHPLTIHAGEHMGDLIDRSLRFRP
jgi:hypothetical protein